MFHIPRFLSWPLLLCTTLGALASVSLQSSPEGPQFLVDGQPFWVRGVTFTIANTPENPQAQERALIDLKNMGANSIRTWGVGDDTQLLLDDAEKHGIKVMLGLWMEHGRDGNEGDGDLNYSGDIERMVKQRESLLAQVAKYKDHPALLLWGLGNEVILNIASETEKIAYAKNLEEVCRAIKAEDPHHPVFSVSAWTTSVPYWKSHTPSLDGYGINAYGGAAAAIPEALREHGADKPYLVTEFGPRGAYDSPKDENQVAIEPTDPEKYEQIVSGWKDWIEAKRDQGCLGGYVFNYGDDSTPTSLWLDMFVQGHRRPAYWATKKAFGGPSEDNGVLGISSLLMSPRKAPAETWIRARVAKDTPAQKQVDLRFVAAIQEGSRQGKNELQPLEHKQTSVTDYRIKTPSQNGTYKVYALATDGHRNMGAATSSLVVSGAAPTDKAASTVATSPAQTRSSSTAMVEIRGNADEGFQLLRDGQPYIIKGVGGDRFYDVLAELGGNTVRTWGVGKNTPGILDAAQKAGLGVTLGLWLGHERHGFNYSDRAQLEAQRQHVEDAVRRYKDHPALLTWGLGNEMEGFGDGDKAAIWKEVNLLALRIKALDANHPVMSVVANVNAKKVKAIQQYAPDIDLLGVNAYAGAAGIGGALKAASWKKPYCITEFGLPGPWEVKHTSWNAPIEPSSREKAGFYYVAQNDIMQDSKQCLGSYAFLWGNKQEATASWFGMFLPSGEKLVTADVMGKAWTGHWPANRAPVIKEANIPFDQRSVQPNQLVEIKVLYKDSDDDPLSYTWEVFPEAKERKSGGDAEAKPEAVKGAIQRSGNDGSATLRTPSKPGSYRLFVTVKDGQGSGAIDNWPFEVK